MTYFVLSPIDTIPEDHLLLAWAEAWTLATGAFSIDDLPLDRELIPGYLVSLFPGEDLDDLVLEPSIAWDRVLEELELRIITEAERAAYALPFLYPFVVRPDAGIILALRDGLNCNVFGASYIAMQVEQLYHHKLAKFWDEDPAKIRPELEFLTPYRRIFEVVSAVAVANFKGGVPILIGESRSVEQSLLPAFAEVCEVIGTGQPKSLDQLNPLQKQANDGGVDAIVIFRDDQQVFECVIVGATTQQSNLRHKVMGSDRRGRVSNYFVDRTVLGPQSGMLTHSNPFDEGVYATCNESGCGYLARELLLAHLQEGNLAGATQRRSFLRSVRGARDPLIALSKLRFQLEFDIVEIPCGA